MFLANHLIDSLTFPPDADRRLHELAEQAAVRVLSDAERKELNVLTEIKQGLAALRSRAQQVAAASQPSAKVVIALERGVPVLSPPTGTAPIDPNLVRRLLQEEGF